MDRDHVVADVVARLKSWRHAEDAVRALRGVSRDVRAAAAPLVHTVTVPTRPEAEEQDADLRAAARLLATCPCVRTLVVSARALAVAESLAEVSARLARSSSRPDGRLCGVARAELRLFCDVPPVELRRALLALGALCPALRELCVDYRWPGDCARQLPGSWAFEGALPRLERLEAHLLAPPTSWAPLAPTLRELDLHCEHWSGAHVRELSCLRQLARLKLQLPRDEGCGPYLALCLRGMQALRELDLAWACQQDGRPVAGLQHALAAPAASRVRVRVDVGAWQGPVARHARLLWEGVGSLPRHLSELVVTLRADSRTLVHAEVDAVVLRRGGAGGLGVAGRGERAQLPYAARMA